MSSQPDALWLNVSPSFLNFERLLVRYLSKQISIAQWEYVQSPDEASSLDIALTLLHDYLKGCDKPIHLMGHGTAGLLGLLYARKHPKQVKSLTLLSVGMHPAVDWQAHYYVLRQRLPCNRRVILGQMVCALFGYQNRDITRYLIETLEKDLEYSPSPHSLYERVTLPTGGVEMPLMVCGGEEDIIVDSRAIQGWQEWMKKGDRIWCCPKGRHFFHYSHSQQVGRQVIRFWQEQTLTKASALSCPETILI